MRIAKVLPTWLALSSALSGCDGSAIERGAPDAARQSQNGNSHDAGRRPTSSNDAGPSPAPIVDGGVRHPIFDGGGSPRSGRDASVADSGAPRRNDASTGSSGDGAADSGNAADSSDTTDAGTDFVRIPDWSVRKRVQSASQSEVVLEEVLASFADALPAKTRVRTLPSRSASEQTWSTPDGAYISDFCRHPSGDVSAIVIELDRTVSLVRLSPRLEPTAIMTIHDPDIASDPNVSDSGALDLLANGVAPDTARIASVGEDVVATVDSSWNSIIAYRAGLNNGAWSVPKRTLIEPPVGLTPFLPIGGSFDTFGAMFDWFRSMLDVDEAGNAYVATWANPRRIRVHAATFGDGATPLPGDPSDPTAGDSDVLVTKMDRDGARVWSRVVGTTHEDEPYALRSRLGVVAVSGRARRLPGFDNTTWDAFVSVLSTDGVLVGTRAIPLDASSIFLAVDVTPTGGLVLGGSDGWTQNPDGLSVLSFGTKLLLDLPTFDAAPVRLLLPAGPRHNEIRTVIANPTRIAFGGHEDGPVMHTGDSDPSLIRATGVIGSVAYPAGDL